jgi:small subunit ribosomal protein S6
LPNSVDSSSLNIRFKYSNKNIPILNKTIQNNSINTLYYQSIGKNINFYINNQKIEGKLLSISNNFIKIKVKNEIFTEFRYYNINSLYGVSFEKDFNFSNKVFDIDLENDKEKNMELSYSVRFNQIKLSLSQVNELISKLKSEIEKFKGLVNKAEYCGLRPLAYQIKKNTKGHFLLLDIKLDKKATNNIQNNLKINENLLRIIIIKVKKHEKKQNGKLKAK